MSDNIRMSLNNPLVKSTYLPPAHDLALDCSMATFCDRALVTPLTASKRPLAPFATFRDAGSSQSIYLIYLSTIFDPVTARFRVLQAGCLVKSGVKKCEAMSVCAEIPARERPRLFVVSNELLSQREEKSAVLPPRFGDTKQRTYRRQLNCPAKTGSVIVKPRVTTACMRQRRVWL